ncbi:MAG TPA: tetratricopeptide repeat protein, partial [Pirellulaceae bacterium]|nr:tetratricopeptide repeat protein [Pirellulaceae bacterium]
MIDRFPFRRVLFVNAVPLLTAAVFLFVTVGTVQAQRVGELIVVIESADAKIKKDVVGRVSAGSIHKLTAIEGNWCAIEGAKGWIPKASILTLAQGLRHYSERIGKNKGDFEAWATRGMIYFELGQLDSAFVDMNEAIRANSRIAAIWHNRGIVLHALGRWPMAVDDFSEAIRLNTSYTRAYHSRGLAYYSLGELDKAILDFTRAIRLDENEPWFYVNRGSAYHAAGKSQEAIQDYLAARKLDPKLSDPLVGLANVYLDKNDLDRAMIAAEEAIKLNPASPKALNVRGWVLFKQHRLEDSLKDFDSAIRQADDFSLAHNNRGVALTELKRYDEAIKSFSRAIVLSPEPTVFVNRAHAHMLAGDSRSAWEDLQRASEMNERLVEGILVRAWFLATCADNELQDPQLAVATWEELPEGFQLDWSAWDIKAAILAATGNFPEAIQAAEKALATAPAHR